MNENEREQYESGVASAQNGGDWRDNPYSRGTSAWFRFEDGRRDGGAEDVGPAPGCPAWA